MDQKSNLDKVTAAGLLVAMGIIYGDIGTSPLYVMKAIVGDRPITEDIVLGGVSCVFWTLTLITTIKYVILILKADNNGEGGTLALFALVRRHAKWLTVPTMIGGAALLADGIIAPPISVSSAIEGLEILYPDIQTIPIVITILTILFVVQIFGTKVVGYAFGPIMAVWFSMLAILGVSMIVQYPMVLKALNPYYAFNLLANYPGGFYLLGAVFLCTTGAEALYSDLGHCGRGNIRISWIYVKTCLILNYFGQAAWLMLHEGQMLGDKKPFFQLMPEWFILPGIAIATMATIIASQAMISGSFSLISAAIRLNFWPKVKIHYPSNERGQLYIPSVNVLLYLGCIAVVLYFRRSENMEAAYGLAITVTMLMDTILMSYFLYTHRSKKRFVFTFLTIFLLIEFAFLFANLEKFPHGGWVSLLICIALGSVMYIWLKASEIKLRLTEFEKLDKYLESLKELSKDITVPKYTTHLIFMSNASRESEIESKIIYSIFQKRPKRADVYWFVHVDTTDEPNTLEYKVKHCAQDDVYKITFRLGFRQPHKIHLYFRHVLEEMVRNAQVDIRSRYESLNKHNVIGDFRFVVLKKFLASENDLPFWENVVMKSYFFVKQFTMSEETWFGLDSSAVKVEHVPLVIRPVENVPLKEIPWDE
ncbi:KUP/HAK/KT family potassium transporter [Jiulongibacter sediminis]|jgi:KUP system potassium uptake protein|uniref:KUP/HAK/KT family potassium transporter n=1 Tax=Jiulongibacter sediminis TaxID=1605367 RepID=UPI0026F0F489|nr:KUP/HAK/KT family potassium transporter [Jiulongibacter sediminis]